MGWTWGAVLLLPSLSGPCFLLLASPPSCPGHGAPLVPRLDPRGTALRKETHPPSSVPIAPDPKV